MSGLHDEGRGGDCPRCGGARSGPEELLCRRCQEAVSTGAAGQQDVVSVRVAPVLREALASARPGEDFDEALLRALKAHYPAHATALLPALTRIIEMEAQRANEGREQIVRRLADADPGPEITLRTSGSSSPKGTAKTVSETTIIRVGDKEYHSLEDVPPDLRRMIERGMSSGRGTRRVGCAAMLAGGLLAVLLGLGKR